MLGKRFTLYAMVGWGKSGGESGSETRKGGGRGKEKSQSTDFTLGRLLCLLLCNMPS